MSVGGQEQASTPLSEKIRLVFLPLGHGHPGFFIHVLGWGCQHVAE